LSLQLAVLLAVGELVVSILLFFPSLIEINCMLGLHFLDLFMGILLLVLVVDLPLTFEMLEVFSLFFL